MEAEADELDSLAHRGLLPPECCHTSAGRSGQLRRTKMFFGARYLWTKEQLARPDSRVRAEAF